MELKKLDFLVLKTSSVEVEEIRFARSVAIYFLKVKAKREGSDVILKDEKVKNIYLTKLFFRKIKSKDLDITFEDEKKIECYYKKLEEIDFWKEVIDFMFGYADADILRFYSQTVNGLFGFYFKHYNRIKLALESRNLDAESRQVQALVRRWTKEEAVKVFYLYLVKIYFHFREREKKNTLKQEYYIYVKYIDSTLGVPRIKQVVLDNSPVLRGLLMEFSPAFSDWMVRWELDIDKVFDYTEFSKLCERGVQFVPGVATKDLNDVLYDALTTYVNNFE
jgi:hypothetical protein